MKNREGFFKLFLVVNVGELSKVNYGKNKIFLEIRYKIFIGNKVFFFMLYLFFLMDNI